MKKVNSFLLIIIAALLLFTIIFCNRQVKLMENLQDQVYYLEEGKARTDTYYQQGSRTENQNAN